jgi:putative spermidine/putrescine transport system permease protein
MSALVSNWRRSWLFALSGLILLFLIVPVLIVIPMSFSASRYLDFPPTRFSLQWYERLFGPGDWFPGW